MCNGFYKIFSKVIVNRMSLCLYELISLEQSTFIRGHKIHDNIQIVQEIAHGIHHSKRKNSVILIKLDLGKAFETLKIKAIVLAFENLNFPRKFIG